MRPLLHALVLAASAALVACSSTTEVAPDQAALDAAAQFQSLADDAFRAGADPDVTTAYRDIGVAVSRNGRISPVTIVVDGTPLDFLATAQEIETAGGLPCTTPQAFCPVLPPLRSIIAWEKANPRRVVQLTVSAAASTIGHAPASTGSLLELPGIAGLFYFDGVGGAYVGTTGTMNVSDPVTSDTPCRTSPPTPSPGAAPDFIRCTLAEFTASFDGTVGVPPFAIRANAAAGTHTIAMASQAVHGARLEVTMPAACPTCEGYPPPALPPVTFQGGALRASLTATPSASAVALELRITNPQTQPVTIQFNSGQQYDFRVRRLDGTVVWTWSANKSFTGALTSRTLGAGETVTYHESWTPTERGSFIAEGRLTSTSHFAAAGAGFTVQ